MAGPRRSGVRRPLTARRLLAALALALLSILPTVAAAGPAQAHASLVVADPAPLSILPTAPRSARLSFTEIVSVTSGGVRIVGPDGRRLQTEARKDPADALSVLVPLPSGLAAGTYTVTWSVVSIDGHPISGAYRFAVVRPSSPLTAPVTGSGTGPSALGATGRALAAGGALALVGLVSFPALVVRRVRSQLDRRLPAGLADQVETQIDRRLPGWAAGCALVAVLGTATVLVDTAARGSGRSLGAVLTDPALALISLFNRTGALLLVRILLLALAGGVLALAARAVRADPGGAAARPTTQLSAALGFAAAGMLTFSLSSHAAAARTDRWLAIGFDAVHLLASALWIGGLLALALVALPIARELGGSDTRLAGEIAGTLSFGFSVVAQLAMVAVLTTGGYAALVQVTGLSDLGQTTWGTALTAKLALWVTVLLIAAFNALALIPKLADRSAGSAERLAAAGNLGSAIRLELLLATGLVVAAALMSATAQPSQVPGRNGAGVSVAQGPRTAVSTGIAQGFRMQVQVRRSGTGPASATVFALDLEADSLNEVDALPRAAAAVGVLRGPDGVDRTFDLAPSGDGTWVSARLAVDPGQYRLTARFDGSGGPTAVPVELTVPA